MHLAHFRFFAMIDIYGLTRAGRAVRAVRKPSI